MALSSHSIEAKRFTVFLLVGKYKQGKLCVWFRQAYVVRAAQSHGACASQGVASGLAGMGWTKRYSPADSGIYPQPARPSLEPAAQARGAILHTAFLAYAERWAARLWRAHHG